MVAIISSKENKSVAKKLINTLENHDIKVWNNYRDVPETEKQLIEFEKNLKHFQIIVFILSQSDLHNQNLLEFYKRSVIAGKNIVLYCISAFTTSDIINWFFFQSHDWIDAYNTTFEQSSQALIDLINELIHEKPVQLSQPETSQNQNSEQPQKNKSISKNTQLIIGAIILIIAVIIGLKIAFSPSNSTKQNLNQITSQPANSQPQKLPSINTTKYTPNSPNQNLSVAEKMLIGIWRMTDYNDHIPRNKQQQQQFEKQIQALKRNFALIFYPNHTFRRFGFSPKPEFGYWSLDIQNHAIYLYTANRKGKDKLKILTLSPNKLIFEVASYIDSTHVSIIQISLKKQPIQSQPAKKQPTNPSK